MLDCDLPQIVRTAQKEPQGSRYEILGDELTSLFERCQFCFELNTFVIVELYIRTYEEARLLIGANFGAVDTFGFEDRGKIFG